MINPTMNPTLAHRRQELLQYLGIFLFLLLLVMDESFRGQHAPVQVIKKSDDKASPKSSEALLLGDLNHMLASKRILSHNLFPRNVSGIYFGKWSDRSSNINGTSEGKVAIQLKAIINSETPEIDYVYGIMSLFHIEAFVDVQYPLQGAYFHDSGELFLYSTPFKSQSLFLELPRQGGVTNTLSPTISANYVNQQDNSSNGSQFLTGGKSESNNHGSEADEMKTARNDAHANSAGLAPQLGGFLASKLGLNTIIDGLVLAPSFPQYLSSRLLPAYLDEELPSDIFEVDTIRGFRKIDGGDALEFPVGIADDQTGVHRHLRISTVPTKIRSLLGVNLYLLDSTATLPSSNLIPFGPKKLPVNFYRMLGDRMGVAGKQGNTGNQLGGVQFHYAARLSKAPIATPPEQFLPACSLEISFNSVPYFKPASLDKKDGGEQDPKISLDQSTQAVNEAKISSNKEIFFASTLAGVVKSPGCGRDFNVSLTSVIFEREKIDRKVMMYSVLASAAGIIQIAVFIIQLKHSQNPAAVAKISLTSAGLNAILDAILCVTHMLMSAAISRYLNHSYVIVVSLLQLCIFGVLEMRLMMRIVLARADSSDNSQQAMRRRLSTLNLGFFGSFFVLSIFFFNSIDRPVLLVFVLYSMWVPQIAFSAYSGTRRALHPTYLIGTSLARLYVPLYFLMCPTNFVIELTHSSNAAFFKSGPTAAVILVVWTAIQVAIVLLQDKLGPRFFIPKYLLPQKYDYFRPYSKHSESSGPSDVESGDLPECIICYNAIENTHGAYMLTPCDHIFHEPCLTQWMQVKLECPVCRAALPPSDNVND